MQDPKHQIESLTLQIESLTLQLEELQTLVNEVAVMRNLQKQYFSSKSSVLLVGAKAVEQRVDKKIKELIARKKDSHPSAPTLF